MMKNSFIQWAGFIIALGFLFFVVLMLFGYVDVEHKGRVFLLVAMAFAVIYLNMRRQGKK